MRIAGTDPTWRPKYPQVVSYERAIAGERPNYSAPISPGLVSALREFALCVGDVPAAAARVGLHRNTYYRWARGVEGATARADALRRVEALLRTLQAPAEPIARTYWAGSREFYSVNGRKGGLSGAATRLDGLVVACDQVAIALCRYVALRANNLSRAMRDLGIAHKAMWRIIDRRPIGGTTLAKLVRALEAEALLDEDDMLIAGTDPTWKNSRCGAFRHTLTPEECARGQAVVSRMMRARGFDYAAAARKGAANRQFTPVPPELRELLRRCVVLFGGVRPAASRLHMSRDTLTRLLVPGTTCFPWMVTHANAAACAAIAGEPIPTQASVRRPRQRRRGEAGR